MYIPIVKELIETVITHVKAGLWCFIIMEILSMCYLCKVSLGYINISTVQIYYLLKIKSRVFMRNQFLQTHNPSRKTYYTYVKYLCLIGWYEDVFEQSHRIDLFGKGIRIYKYKPIAYEQKTNWVHTHKI